MAKAPTTTTPELSKINTAPSLEDLMREPSIDGLMSLAQRLSSLTKAASVALANAHFVNGRIDHRNYLRASEYVGPPLDAPTMSRLRAMSVACSEFSLALRNARLLGVHDETERASIIADYIG
jgi:hypothetical protein